jgi:nucleotide-binding universal stress UspA family protein
VILIPPRCCMKDFVCEKILVPLDGQKDHEAGLPWARELARRTGASLHLLTVIPTPGKLGGEQAAVRQMLPGTMSALLDIQEEHGEHYLENLALEMRKEKIGVRTRVLRGDPVPAIVQYAQSLPADLLVVATHAKTGTDAFWSGSASPRITGRSQSPLLFVPIKD